MSPNKNRHCSLSGLDCQYSKQLCFKIVTIKYVCGCAFESISMQPALNDNHLMCKCFLVPDLCPFERMIVYGINVCSPLLSSNKAIIEKWEHAALFAPKQCDFQRSSKSSNSNSRVKMIMRWSGNEICHFSMCKETHWTA